MDTSVIIPEEVDAINDAIRVLRRLETRHHNTTVAGKAGVAATTAGGVLVALHVYHDAELTDDELFGGPAEVPA
jgi:hypothetical protein